MRRVPVLSDIQGSINIGLNEYFFNLTYVYLHIRELKRHLAVCLLYVQIWLHTNRFVKGSWYKPT